MESLILVAASVLVGLLLAFGLAMAWRAIARNGDAPPPPLFAMLCSRGRAADQVQDELGPDAMAVALCRCLFCASSEICRQRAAAGQSMPDYCPNAEFIAHACSSRTT